MYNRRSPRLRNYDYTQGGAYFVTICSYGSALIFGYVADGKMLLNDLGKLVDEEWRKTAAVRPTVELDLYIVMPNHIHGILLVAEHQQASPAAVQSTLPANSLGSIVAQFKSVVTKRSRRLAYPPSTPIWNRNYYDHIVRNEQDLDRIRRYIFANPARWSEDAYYIE